MNLSHASSVVDGHLIGQETVFSGVTTDSRAPCPGQLFIALEGDRFDAHEFIAQAQEQGAVAAIVHKEVGSNIPQVRVKNTLTAFGALAKWRRSQYQIPVIGVTGSVGKTSVKEMLASIFSLLGKGVVTEGNLNNEIGVPMTLMRLDSSDQYAIIEMGMNRAGEISRLSKMTEPTIAVINNAAAAHLEGLGSVEQVALAKGEIFEGLQKSGIAVINADDEYLGVWKELAKSHPQISFGLAEDADVRAEYSLLDNGIEMQVTAMGDEFELSLPLMGKHNVLNALAVIAVSYAANVPWSTVKQGLLNYSPIKGRLNIISLGVSTLIDDTYNANPASMRAAIEVLAQYPSSTLIVGDMGELGGVAAIEHKRIGELAHQFGINQLLAVGDFAALTVQGFSGEARAFDSQQDLIEFLNASSSMRSAVLVKGSRSAKMENVVEALSVKYSTGDHKPDTQSRGQS
jgi:UDP-N-acetylmuramoyl-tripeptide--D-alanyl-D-alanine ligase